MKLIVFLLFSVLTLSCSKDSNDNQNHDSGDRKLSLSVYDYVPPTYGNHYWGIDVKFDKPVTLTGDITVSFEVWDRGALYKKYEVPVSLNLNKSSLQFYKTDINSLHMIPEIRNVKGKDLRLSGGSYNIEY